MAASSDQKSLRSYKSVLNQSRCGYYDTKYFTDIKDYFNEKNFDDKEIEKNKENLIELLCDFRELLEDAKKQNGFYDVEFVKEDEDVMLPAHRQMLIARSALFENIFNSDSDEVLGFKRIQTTDDPKKPVRISLPSDMTLAVMETLLHYMYWGYIKDINDNDLKLLFRHACLLDLKELRRRLGERLAVLLPISNANDVLDYLRLSVEGGCKYLKYKCIDYIIDNKNKILKTNAWDEFIMKQDNKELLKEIYQRNSEFLSK